MFNKPKVDITNEFIKVRLPPGTLLIDINTSQLYFNGHLIKQDAYRSYDSNFTKDKTDKYPPKKKIFEHQSKGYVFQINRGHDERLFFHLYKESDFYKYRRPPIWQGSLWGDKWYSDNLYSPISYLPIPVQGDLAKTSYLKEEGFN